ncbi:hypothetical protein AMECASPLE_038202, partial [Ameca splendens]
TGVHSSVRFSKAYDWSGQAGGLYEGGTPALLRLSVLTTAACKPSSMLEILFEPPITNLDFFSPGSLLPGSRSCIPSSLIVFDLPALPQDPSGPSDLVAYLRSSTAPDSHLSPPRGSIPPENLTSGHAPL